jgi:chromosome segregation ATPase
MDDIASRVANDERALIQLADELQKVKAVSDERAEKLLELTSLCSELTRKVSVLTSRLDTLATSISQVAGNLAKLDQATKWTQSKRRPKLR